jgi:hypothetical protein
MSVAPPAADAPPPKIAEVMAGINSMLMMNAAKTIVTMMKLEIHIPMLGFEAQWNGKPG